MYDNDSQKPEYSDRTGIGFSADGSYRYVRPESREMLYRDATVEPAEDSARMPRSYTPPQKAPREKPKPPVREAAAHGDAGRGFWTKAICMCMACALLGGLVGSGITAVLLRDSLTQAVVIPSEAPDTHTNDTQSGVTVVSTPTPNGIMSPGAIYAAACSQVVGITTEVNYYNYFGTAVTHPVSGTGFFLSSDGYLLTNYHVIEYAVEYGSAVKVITYDGNEYQAVIVGSDKDNDIAVLQIDATGLSAAALGNSDSIQVGDTVYAVGNPLGELQFSMTTGSISATDRLISTEDASPAINMFQIDAAVNQGNSGGPVYDTAGNVIGIVTAKYSDEGIEGIGFAIPINDAVSIATDLITTGYVTGKAKLGVEAQTVSARAAKYYNTVEGALLRYIAPDSCAEQAGLQVGDIVYRFGNFEVLSKEDLQAAVRSYHAGDTVELQIYRNYQHITVIVTLDESIPDTARTNGAGNPEPMSYLPYDSRFF